jgi:hypothetical protein
MFDVDLNKITNIEEIGLFGEKGEKKRVYFNKSFFTSYTGISMTAPTKSSGTAYCKLIVDGEQISGSKTHKLQAKLGLEFHGNRDFYFLTSSAFYDFADEKIKAWNGYGYATITDWGMPELAEKITELVK